MKRKNYNPFKMIGSWIGLGLAIFLDSTRGLSIIHNNGIPTITSKIITILFYPIKTIYNYFITFNSFVLLASLIAVYGFIIGYIIHSLIRRFK